jgi:hypothetical protein
MIETFLASGQDREALPVCFSRSYMYPFFRVHLPCRANLILNVHPSIYFDGPNHTQRVGRQMSNPNFHFQPSLEQARRERPGVSGGTPAIARRSNLRHCLYVNITSGYPEAFESAVDLPNLANL